MTGNFQDGEVQSIWEEILDLDAYRVRLSEIASCYPDDRSLSVTYADIAECNMGFAVHLLDNPDDCLEIGRKSIMNAMPSGWNPLHWVNLRIEGLPKDAHVDIRHLRAKHLGKMVAVEGLVRKATTVRPRMVNAVFKCDRCGATVEVEQTGMVLREPLACICSGNNKQVSRFTPDRGMSQYIDTQKVEVQESPEGLRGGAQPERLTVYVEGDISGTIAAGNRVTFNGVIRSVEKTDRDKSTVFEIYMDALSVEFEQHEYDEIQITEEDEREIKAMSRDPRIFENIIGSISPTIYGMSEVKGAIALQLFGGCHKEMDDGTVLRGDMHILLMGDPGVAKSQILRYMSHLAPRGIYASGKSASAAGLTAAAVRDDFGDGRFTLEAGALVLADKGLACIDELDKMTDQDRSSLHEAMESQRISVAKAGITATLQCRCSMLAAANPKFGRFDIGAPIVGQIDLPPALMSRFDLIFVLTDKPDAKLDGQVTSHILGVHRRGQVRQLSEDAFLEGINVDAIKSESAKMEPVYDVPILRKYVAYSKRIVPVMTDEAMDKIYDNYMGIRASGASEGDSVPITPRQLEAFVRLSEASARMRLSPRVEEEDAERAVSLVMYYLGKILAPNGGAWDMDRMYTAVGKKDRGKADTLLAILEKEPGRTFQEHEIFEEASRMGIPEEEVHGMLGKLSAQGLVFSARPGLYKKA